jgi:hypothetical protein
LLLLPAILALAAVLFVTLPVETLGDETRVWNETPFRELILFALMIVGMAARYMTHAIELRRERIKELSKEQGGIRGRKPKLEFDAWEFSYPLFVSVVTFGALLSQIGDSFLTLANTILSFQTGFFWQTVLAKRDTTGQ